MSARRSGWAYSQERDTFASRARASNEIGCPALSIRRSAAMARRRVAVARRRAAATMWCELSARMRGVHALRRGLFDLADHPVEVVENLLVHLDHAGLPAAFGHIDQGESAPLLLAQFG